MAKFQFTELFGICVVGNAVPSVTSRKFDLDGVAERSESSNTQLPGAIEPLLGKFPCIASFLDYTELPLRGRNAGDSVPYRRLRNLKQLGKFQFIEQLKKGIKASPVGERDSRDGGVCGG